MKPVIIKHIADTLDCLMDEWKYYLNKKTGEIVEIQEEYLSIAEELEEDEELGSYMDWEQDSIREALLIFENWNDYIELPDKYEINEYSIMESFCYSINNEKLRVKLCNAISGRGAFRRFKDAIIRYGVENEWYNFKFEALCKIARDWCDLHEIPYVEE